MDKTAKVTVHNVESGRLIISGKYSNVDDLLYELSSKDVLHEKREHREIQEKQIRELWDRHNYFNFPNLILELKVVIQFQDAPWMVENARMDGNSFSEQS